ncbi:hypothetical protein V8U11_19400 [Pseudomonas chlororaphis]|uniref:hypothetical protein n=1 Tax=Pseudomonas chlororaphis TaxID=587753 RepID=UPI0030D0BB1D
MNMEKIEYIRGIAEQVERSIMKIFGMMKTSDVTEEVHALRESLNGHLHRFGNSLATGVHKVTRTSSKQISSEAMFLALILQHKSTPEIADAAAALESLCHKLRAASDELFSVERSPSDEELLDSDLKLRSKNGAVAKLNDQLIECSQQGERIKRQLGEDEVRIAELEVRVKQLEADAHQEIQKVVGAYTDSLVLIEEKKSEINDILGHVAGRAIAGDYDKSAAEEKKMADWLRYAALVCMFLIVAVLFSAVLSTIGNSFDWDKFLSRVSLVFLLSVPAAYLARESAKHREQQYQHLQTSLDMKAVSPFLASLPEEERHKIKSAIASRIFGGKDFSKVGGDSYPINTHEVIMEIIKKLDVSDKTVRREPTTPA